MAFSYKNIRLFDKSGNELNTAFEDRTGFMYAKVHLPKTSAGINENEHIFILERMANDADGLDTYFAAPRANYTESKIRARLLDGDDEIFLYTVDYSNSDFPIIVKSESVSLSIQHDNGDDVNTVGQRWHILDAISQALQFNIGLNGQEGTYNRVLVIEEIETLGSGIPSIDTQSDDMSPQDGSVVHTIALIEIYGEVEGEDERLRKMLENFGKKVNQDDSYIFRDYDIEEDLPDWKIINQKRKELLLEGDNIYPYIGSYKALLNAINFFGYQDLRIKEYWLNVDANSPSYKTYKHVTIKNGDGTIEFSDRLLPSTNYKKTSLFGLFYDINKASGEFDDFGIPIVEDAFMFTQDEVIFKLFGLRDILKKEFLPLNARIIDICGEGIYFERYRVSHWEDQLGIINQELGITPSFRVYTKGYIEDIRQRERRYLGSLGRATIKDVYNWTISSLVGKPVSEFFRLDRITNLPDGDEKMRIGCPITVINDTFKMPWDDVGSTWDGASGFTWDAIRSGQFYEAEWVFEKQSPNYFRMSSGRKNIEDLKLYDTVLPYSGEYTVTLNLFDTSNGVSKRSIPVEVKLPEIEISAIYRAAKHPKSWDEMAGKSWDSERTIWRNVETRKKTTWDDMKITWDDMSWFRFVDQEVTLNEGPYDPNLAMRHIGSKFTWERMKEYRWEDMQSTTWDALDMHGNTYCGFLIKDYDVGGKITILGLDETFEMQGTYGSTWEGLAQELNECNQPGFRDFYYVVRNPNPPTDGEFNDDFNFDFNVATLTPVQGDMFIHAVAKQHGGGYIYAMRFEDGMESEFTDVSKGNSYPLVNSLMWIADLPLPDSNHPPLWNYLYRTYVEWAGNNEFTNPVIPAAWYTPGSVENWQNPVHPAISGYFNWQETVMVNGHVPVEVGVPIFFICDRSKIHGKKNIKWTLYDENMEMIASVTHPFLLWTPSSPGRIFVEVQMEDFNGNVARKMITNL